MKAEIHQVHDHMKTEIRQVNEKMDAVLAKVDEILKLTPVPGRTMPADGTPSSDRPSLSSSFITARPTPMVHGEEGGSWERVGGVSVDLRCFIAPTLYFKGYRASVVHPDPPSTGVGCTLLTRLNSVSEPERGSRNAAVSECTSCGARAVRCVRRLRAHSRYCAATAHSCAPPPPVCRRETYRTRMYAQLAS
eukprot:2210997-Prymnesium_polylepis.1